MAELKETCIERIAGDSYCTVYTSERKNMNKLVSLLNKYPNEVKLISNDGESVMVHVPADWMQFVRPPKKMNLTEEQRKAAAERLKKSKENHANND